MAQTIKRFSLHVTDLPPNQFCLPFPETTSINFMKYKNYQETKICNLEIQGRSACETLTYKVKPQRHPSILIPSEGHEDYSI